MDFNMIFAPMFWFLCGAFFTVSVLGTTYFFRVWQLRKRAETVEGVSRIDGTRYLKIIINPAELSHEGLKAIVRELELIEQRDGAKCSEAMRKDTNDSENERRSDE